MSRIEAANDEIMAASSARSLDADDQPSPRSPVGDEPSNWAMTAALESSRASLRSRLSSSLILLEEKDGDERRRSADDVSLTAFSPPVAIGSLPINSETAAADRNSDGARDAQSSVRLDRRCLTTTDERRAVEEAGLFVTPRTSLADALFADQNLADEEPIFVSALALVHNAPLIEGSALNFCCRVAGHPTPFVTFYHNNLPIRHNKRRQIGRLLC